MCVSTFSHGMPVYNLLRYFLLVFILVIWMHMGGDNTPEVCEYFGYKSFVRVHLFKQMRCSESCVLCLLFLSTNAHGW